MWTLQFKDINDATITVEIEGGNGTLTGAAEPLITRELETDDPFEPVRYQTGYINLVGTDGADIRPADTFDRPVTIKKNGAIVWLGYIAVEEWNNSMSEYPLTVQLPLISALGVLDYVEYQAEAASKTIGQVLHKALSMAQVSWGNVMYGVQDASVFTYTLSDYAFRNDSERKDKRYMGINPDMPERKEGRTALDVVREVCKVFGWQAREDGQNLFLSSADAGASYCITSFASLNGTPTATSGSGVSKSLSMASTMQSRSMLPPKNQVRIVADRQDVDDEVFSLGSLMNKLRFWQEQNGINYQGVQRYFADCYYADSNLVSVANLGGMNNAIKELRQARQESQMNFFGAWLGADVYVNQKRYYITESETDTSPVLVLTCGGTTVSDDITFYCEEFYDFSGQTGNIDIEINGIAMNYTDELQEPPEDAEKAQFPVVNAKLKFGNSWWNPNDGWSYHEKAFPLNLVNDSMEPGEWRHNCKGRRVPLPDYITSGKFTLIIQAPRGGYPNTKYARVSSLTMTLRPYTKKNAYTENGELHFNAECQPTARDTYKQEQSLYCWRNDQIDQIISYGRINTPATAGNITQALLNRMQTWYNRSHMRLQVDARGTDFKPMDTASFNSYNCIIGARQVNWRDNETRLTLYSK